MEQPQPHPPTQKLPVSGLSKALTPLDELVFGSSSSSNGNSFKKSIKMSSPRGLLPAMKMSSIGSSSGSNNNGIAGLLSLEEVLALQAQLLSSMSIQTYISVCEKIEELALSLCGCSNSRLFVAERSPHGDIQLKAKTKLGETLFACTGITGYVAINGQEAIVNNLSNDERFLPVIDGLGLEASKVRNLVSLPVISPFTGRLLACLTVVNKKVGSGFNGHDLGYLRLVAQQAGASLEMAHRFEAAAQLQKRYRSLFDAFVRLTELSTTGELVHYGGEVAKELTNASSASCFVLSNDQFDLCTWATVNSEHAKVLKKTRVPLRGVLHTVVQEAQSCAPRPQGDESEQIFITQQDKVCPAYRFHMGTLIAPVLDEQRRPIGVIQVRGKKIGTFDSTDGLLLSACSVMIATMLGNVRVSEELGSSYDDMLNESRKNLPALCAAVSRRCMWATDSAHCSIYVLDRNGEFLWKPPNENSPTLASLQKLSANSYPIGFACMHNALLTNESPMPSNADLRQTASAAGVKEIREWVAVPFYDAASNVRGVVLVANRNAAPRGYSRMHCAAVTGIAKTCGPYLCLGVEYYERTQDELSLQGMETKLNVALDGLEGLLGIENEAHLLSKLGVIVQQFIRCEHCIVFMPPFDHESTETESGSLALASAANGDIPSISVHLGKGLVGHVVSSGVAVRAVNVNKDPNFNKEVDVATKTFTRNVLCVPIYSSSHSHLKSTKNGAGVIACILLVNKVDADEFNEHDERHLRGFGRVSAVAIEKILASKKAGEKNLLLQRLVLRHNILSAIDRMIPNAKKLDRLAVGVAAVAKQCVGASSSIFYLVDRSGHKLFGYPSLGDDPASSSIPTHVAHETVSDWKGIAGEVVRSSAPIIVMRSANHDTRFDASIDVAYSAEQSSLATGSLLSMPITVENEVVGVIQVARTEDEAPFRAEEEALLRAVVGKASFAITNAMRDDTILALRRFLKDIPLAHDLDSAVKGVCSFAKRATRCQRAQLYMVNSTRNEVWTRIQPENGGDTKIVRVDIGKGSVGHAARLGAAIVCTRANSASHFDAAVDCVNNAMASTIAAVPVRDTSTGAIICVMQGLNKRHGEFSPTDLLMLQFCGKMASMLVSTTFYKKMSDECGAKLQLLSNTCREVFSHQRVPDMLVKTARSLSTLFNATVRIYILSATDNRRWQVFSPTGVEQDQLRTGIAAEVILKGELICVTKSLVVEGRQMFPTRSSLTPDRQSAERHTPHSSDHSVNIPGGSIMKRGGAPKISGVHTVRSVRSDSTPGSREIKGLAINHEDRIQIEISHENLQENDNSLDWASSYHFADSSAVNGFCSLCTPIFASSSLASQDGSFGVIGALEVVSISGSRRLFLEEDQLILSEVANTLSAAVAWMEG